MISNIAKKRKKSPSPGTKVLAALCTKSRDFHSMGKTRNRTATWKQRRLSAIKRSRSETLHTAPVSVKQYSLPFPSLLKVSPAFLLLFPPSFDFVGENKILKKKSHDSNNLVRSFSFLDRGK